MSKEQDIVHRFRWKIVEHTNLCTLTHTLTMLNSKLIEGIFVYPFLTVIKAFLVVLPILTSDTFSLFTLFFVLFPLNTHISRNNAALHAIFTK